MERTRTSHIEEDPMTTEADTLREEIRRRYADAATVAHATRCPPHSIVNL